MDFVIPIDEMTIEDKLNRNGHDYGITCAKIRNLFHHRFGTKMSYRQERKKSAKAALNFPT